jgi:asparagine synthase (glutamine-hydrolysing)
MCGITGIINNKNKKPVLIDEIKRMNDAIIHRGPDDEGYYFGEYFAFGHRRLSIIDLSPAGRQPMQYKGKNGEYVITYNGELKEELKKDGDIFNTHTDTEVILASYDRWGVDCLNKFNGMWAFVIYDKSKYKFFIIIDILGKNLYIIMLMTINLYLLLK